MEQEDGPEDKEGVSEIRSGIESDGRGNILFIVPPVDFTPQNWRLAKDLKVFFRVVVTILSDSERNLLVGPVNKETEESKGGNEEDDDDKDSLRDRKRCREINQYL